LATETFAPEPSATPSLAVFPTTAESPIAIEPAVSASDLLPSATLPCPAATVALPIETAPSAAPPVDVPSEVA